MRRALTVSMVTLAMLAMAHPAWAAGDEKEVPAAAPQATIAVAFKLDPRLSGSTYGGERWVSPKTFTGASAQDTVEARAVVSDSRGRPLKVSPSWTSSDPEATAVAPAHGGQVRITVKRPGESSVTVTSGGASRKLAVKATQANGRWQVNISQ